MKGFKASLAATGLLISSLALAGGEVVPEQIDLSDVPAVLVDEIAIPIPREIFVSLDKIEPPGWHKYIRLTEVKVPAGRGEIALLFGLVISNGFVAVEAEDTEEVIQIGRDVLRLATALGVKKSVVMHTQSIIEGAKADEWTSVRRELDLAQENVRAAMRELRDDDIAQLVSIGGWLGGTEVLSAILDRSYNEESSDLLNQPDLLHQITARFGAIPSSIRQGPVMDEIGKALQVLNPLLQADSNGIVGRETVTRIHDVTSRLVAMIYQQNLKSAGGSAG